MTQNFLRFWQIPPNWRLEIIYSHNHFLELCWIKEQRHPGGGHCEAKGVRKKELSMSYPLFPSNLLSPQKTKPSKGILANKALSRLSPPKLKCFLKHFKKICKFHDKQLSLMTTSADLAKLFYAQECQMITMLRRPPKSQQGMYLISTEGICQGVMCLKKSKVELFFRELH